MSEIKFSKEVIDRAKALRCEYVLLPNCTGLLRRIAYLERWRRELQILQPSPLSFLIEQSTRTAIAEAESILSQYDVTGDDTATAYMEAIEPKLKRYLSRYQELKARHLRELNELNASFV